MCGIPLSEQSPEVRWRGRSVRVALAAGLAAIAVAIAVTVSRAPLVVVGTNSIQANAVVGETWGPLAACQGGEAVPRGTTAVRLWLTGNIKPRVRVTLLAASKTVSSGVQESGELGKVTTVLVTRVPRALMRARLCYSIGRAVQALDLYGEPTSNPGRGEPAGKMRVEYLRPSSSSWWSRAGSIARRLGLGRAPAGAAATAIALAAIVLAALLASWTVLRVLGGERRVDGRRVPGPAWACACVAFLSAVGWSIVTPPFQAPDEPSHFAYAQILAETGTLPATSTAAYSPEEMAVLADLEHQAVRFNPAVGTIATAAREQRLRQDMALGLSRVGRGASVASSQPPLYYALETVPYYLGSGGTLLVRLELMRLLSALLAAVTACFVFMFLREALPAVRWAWTVGGLCTALAPLLGFISGIVNPDAMLSAVAAALFYCLARAFRHGLTPRRAVAIGAVTAIGFLTKLNFIGLAPGVVLALAILTRRAARISKRSAYRSLAVALAVGWSPVGVYVLINVLSGHRTLGLLSAGVSGTSAHHGTPWREVVYIWESYLPRLPGMSDYFPGIAVLRRLWFDRMVGVYGWLDTYFPGWVYGVALVPATLIAALCVRELVRVRGALRARAGELLSYAAIAVGLLVLIGADSYLEFPTRAGAYSEPRYLLPLGVLLAALAALAARGAGRRWGPAVGVLLVMLILAHDVFSQLLVLGRYYA